MKKLLLISALLLSGCMSYRLPEVQGDQVVYRRTDPLGGTTIDAKGVRVTKTFIKADHVSWTVTYPQWSVHLAVDGYKQRRDKPDTKVSVDEEKETP